MLKSNTLTMNGSIEAMRHRVHIFLLTDRHLFREMVRAWCDGESSIGKVAKCHAWIMASPASGG